MEATKRRWKIWHIIGFGMLGLAVVVGAILALVLSLTRPVVVASDAFMTALKDGNFESAYAMGTPALQSELGSPQAIGAMFAASRPVEWSWSSRQIRNATGSVSGSVTYVGGSESDVAISLLPEGEDWRIAGFQMNPPQ